MTDDAYEALAAEARAADVLRTEARGTGRPRTLDLSRLPKRNLLAGAALYPEPSQPLPMTRGDCVGGPRPCPLVLCKFNLFLDIHPKTGNMKLNAPGKEPEDMVESCAIDVADRGGMSHKAIAALLNVSRERVRIQEKRLLRVLGEAIVKEREEDEP